MKRPDIEHEGIITGISKSHIFVRICLLYTSDAADD